MSSGSVRRVSREDIQTVQNLIERCLQLYMSPKEVVETLLAQAKIEPGFTELVWQKLEEENQEFFKAYYLRLLLKEQITEFNRLLKEHAELSQLHSTSVASLPNSNGSHIPALAQNLSCYAAEQGRAAMKPENIQCTVDSSLHNVFNNGASSLHTNMHAVVEMSTHRNRIDSPQSMLSTQSSSMGLVPGINGGMIKSEPGYSGSSPYIFAPDGTVLEACPTIGDASVTSFTSVDSNSHSMNGALLDPDIPSFGVLGQISRNLSLSDLTADFSQSSDIIESYPRCPYLATPNENFLERGEQG
ncbi:uncharacterized protein LOC113872879 [Abrus precatorius]|uniref:Uncharacterized protein LOC113872879 n=1 Tax=Abrus precatorius TaxID=3816 RepID=A0A8B8MFN4_ABRPR|nr:uncharacterized protein LOC113872879 [Abrus precatorius]XP_027366553.1 uncharacterized protein LOC113872879 [Abrus precatorius]